MDTLKVVGVLLLGLLFLVMELAFLAAAITWVVVIICILAATFGLFELSNVQPNWWLIVSMIWMIMSGIENQFKSSFKTWKEVKSAWRDYDKDTRIL